MNPKLQPQNVSRKTAIRRFLLFASALLLIGLSISPHMQSAEEQQAVSAVVDNITLIPSIRYQTMRGWEATAEGGQLYSPAWNSYKDLLLNNGVNDLGINRVRLEIKSGSENPTDYFLQWRNGQITESEYNSKRHEIINDDANPNTINACGFKWSAMDNVITEMVLPLRSRSQARGESLWVNVTYVDFGPSAFEHKNSPAEYAEFVLATYQHLQSTFGFVPNSWEVVLEPHTTEANWTRVEWLRRLKLPEIDWPSTVSRQLHRTVNGERSKCASFYRCDGANGRGDALGWRILISSILLCIRRGTNCRTSRTVRYSMASTLRCLNG